MMAEMALPIPSFSPSLLLDECPAQDRLLGAIKAHPAILPKRRRIHLPVGMLALLAAAHCLADGVASEKGVAEAYKVEWDGKQIFRKMNAPTQSRPKDSPFFPNEPSGGGLMPADCAAAVMKRDPAREEILAASALGPLAKTIILIIIFCLRL